MDRGSADTGFPPTDHYATSLQQAERALAEHDRQLRVAAAEVAELRVRLHAQELRDRRQATLLQEVQAICQTLTAQVSALTTAAAARPPPVPLIAPSSFSVREPSLANPRPFDGAFAQYRGFIMQCDLIFCHQPTQFSSSAARVAFVINLTTGDALNWAHATLTARPELFQDYENFIEEFRRVFDHPTAGREVGTQLMSLHQGGRTVASYATEFRTLAAGSGWNGESLSSAFRRGLSEAVKDELVRDRPTSLNELISLAIDLDERARERRRERACFPPSSSRSLTPVPGTVSPGSEPLLWGGSSTTRTSGEEPMQLGRTHLTVAERERRRSRGLCLYCGEQGHLREACPRLLKA